MTTTIEEQLQDIPTAFSVVVLMQRQPSTISKWSDYQWEAVGVMVQGDDTPYTEMPQLVFEDGEVKRYLYGRFRLTLHADECESYYYNLISPEPRCYVVARTDDDNIPVPFLVSMSFDEVHAYIETDEQVFAVAIPAELYRWIEDFVLLHYAPEKRKKRKRDEWKEAGEKGRMHEH